MRAQRPAGEDRYNHSERLNGRRRHKTLRGLAIAGVAIAAIGGQVAFGHFSHSTGVGGVQIASSGTIQPANGGLGGPGVP